ncbi:RNA polymerase sigma factor [Streptomyces iconiensis]|uniref:RNA polymerase sigma factor n=1 Tax=Streptomyces iconiensis TaxID=1384038 RepID=A0ABT7A0K3_9ACTN|nr:RNA polymerase sigma factor [Streptomyces iconiensis]MDJ1134836.1 RNA polymerase sigma factor [Streptomyces iconiensis]
MTEERGAGWDAGTVAALVAGDRTAFEAVYRRYAPWLVARLRYRCSDRAVLDDVVQETFLALWRACDRGRQPQVEDLAGWLWRIAARRLADAGRAKGARARLHQALGALRTRDEPSAEDQALLGVEHGRLARALADLAPELRSVLQAMTLDGMSVRETAALLDLPEGTVKTRAMRARRHLRASLERAAQPSATGSTDPTTPGRLPPRRPTGRRKR